MMTKRKIHLTEEQETLLITLYSRALDNRRPEPVLPDPYAAQILARVEYDFEQLKVSHGTAITLVLRARKFDAYARDFITAHPEAVVAHLGCGLDSRYFRLRDGSAGLERVAWYDLDLPPVIALRREFYPQVEGYQLIAASAADLAWTEQVAAGDRPVLVLAEGLSMYLHADQVKALVLHLKETYPGCHLVFDAYSNLTVRNVGRHPSVRRTGATIHWGIDDAREIETWAPGIKLVEEWSFNQSDAVPRLSFGDRLIFGITSLFPVVLRAHRVLYFELSS
jgi:O-methyltransferase involved in polyketide biosynthesis